MRWKMLLVTLLGALALAACDNGATARLYVAPHPIIPNHYAVSLLDPQFFDAPGDLRVAINSYGQVASMLPNGNPRTFFLWTPTTPNGATGVMFDFSTIVTGHSVTFLGLNDDGQILGATDTSVFLWTPKQPNGMIGAVTNIRSQANLGNAVGFNGFGQILVPANVFSATESAPYLWTPNSPNSPTGVAIALGKLHDNDVRVTVVAINNQGQIAGTDLEHALPNGTQHIVLWSPQHANSATGAMVDLGIPNGNSDATVTGLSNSGAIIGQSYYQTPDTDAVAFLWVPAQTHGATGTFTTVTPLPGDAQATPQAVNSSLLVAGTSWSNPLFKHPFLWDPKHGTRSLSAMLTGPAIVNFDPLRINDDGQIVGIGVASDGYEHIIVLSPQA